MYTSYIGPHAHNNSKNDNLTQMQVDTSSKSPEKPCQGTAARERHRTWTCPVNRQKNANKMYGISKLKNTRRAYCGVQMGLVYVDV